LVISVGFIWLDCERVHALSPAVVVGWELLTSSSFVVRVGIEVGGVVIKKSRKESLHVWQPSNCPFRNRLVQRVYPTNDVATMDDLIDEILAEMPDPVPEGHHFIDLDDQVPPPVQLPAAETAEWVEILNDAKDEFEVDGATAVFSTWRVEAEDPLDIGDIEIIDGMHARAGRLALNARMTDARAAQFLTAFPEGEFVLKLKFLREQNEGDWVVEDKFDPVHAERKKGQSVIKISRDTKPGVLTGIDSVFYQNAYPVTAVVYGLYPLRNPDPANLAPLRDGDLNCVAQRVMQHFEGALRGQGLTPTRRRKIQDWEERVRELGATVNDVAKLEKILKRAIILSDIAGEDIYNSGKYQGGHRHIELIVHNGHAWSKDLHFPQSREVHFYEGDV